MISEKLAPVETAILFADFLSAHATVLLQRWRESVRDDDAIPSTGSLTREELTDHLPEVLCDIEALLRRPTRGRVVLELESDTERHGQERWLQGYSLYEVMVEIGRFRTLLTVGAVADFATAHPFVDQTSLRDIEHRLHDYAHELILGSVQEFTEAKDAELRAASDELTVANRSLGRVNSLLRAEGEKVRLLSLTDELTGLGNRRHLLARLEDEIANHARHGGGLIVVMLDLDRFKAVNDTWGHAAGDRVLVAVAEVLASRVRATDTVARYGGEEFALVLPRTSTDEALVLLGRIRSGIGELAVDGVDAVVSASFGLTARHEEADGLALLSLADRGVYAAKTSGRDRVCAPDGTRLL